MRITKGALFVRRGSFFDAHTDKTVVTVESNCSGTVLKIALEPEITVPVLTPVAVVGEPGEDAEAALANYKTDGSCRCSG